MAAYANRMRSIGARLATRDGIARRASELRRVIEGCCDHGKVVVMLLWTSRVSMPEPTGRELAGLGRPAGGRLH